MRARLIQRAADIDIGWIADVDRLGLTAGASAPEVLVQEVVDCLRAHRDVSVREVETTREVMSFKLPRGLEPA